MRSIAAWLLGVACVTASSTSAQAELKLGEIQASHGPLGPQRETLDVFPHDELFFRFMISGAKVSDQGEASPSVTIKVLEKDGSELFSDTTPVTGVLALGGNELPGTAAVELGDQLPPGTYTLEVIVKDTLSGEEANFRREFQFKKAQFAIVSPRFAYDAEYKVAAPAGGITSQTLFFRLKAIGFDRSQDRIDAEMQVQVLDGNDQPMMPQPIKATLVNEDPNVVKQAPFLTFSGQMVLNRAGDFKLRISVLDKVSGQETQFETPLRVTAHGPNQE
ncbi:MAG: hypothetical protein WD847_06005 [Pirellulales bacterium]